MPTDRERQTAMDQLVQLLSADDRIVAVVLVGSMASGNTDRWSDVDLEVAVDGSADTATVAADWVTRIYAEFEVAHHFEVSFGAALVRGFLLNGRLEVVSLASQRHGDYADFFDYVDALPAEERAPLEGSLVGSLADADLIVAIESATRGYLAELRRGDPALAARLGPPLLEMVAAVRDRRPRDAR